MMVDISVQAAGEFHFNVQRSVDDSRESGGNKPRKVQRNGKPSQNAFHFTAVSLVLGNDEQAAKPSQ
jgi:hypothetical protein